MRRFLICAIFEVCVSHTTTVIYSIVISAAGGDGCVRHVVRMPDFEAEQQPLLCSLLPTTSYFSSLLPSAPYIPPTNPYCCLLLQVLARDTRCSAVDAVVAHGLLSSVWECGVRPPRVAAGSSHTSTAHASQPAKGTKWRKLAFSLFSFDFRYLEAGLFPKGRFCA